MLTALSSRSSEIATVIHELHRTLFTSFSLHHIFYSHRALTPAARWLIQGEGLSLVRRQTPRVNKQLRSWRRNLLSRCWGHLAAGQRSPSLSAPPQKPEQDFQGACPTSPGTGWLHIVATFQFLPGSPSDTLPSCTWGSCKHFKVQKDGKPVSYSFPWIREAAVV